jgi:hypothetical protein
VPLQVLSISPVKDTVVTDLLTPITLLFNQAIKPGAGQVEVRIDSSTGTVVQRFEIATSPEIKITNNTLTITPSIKWPTSSTLYVVLSQGSILDLAGNNTFTLPTPYDFITALAAPPTTTTSTNTNLNYLIPMPSGSILSGSSLKSLLPQITNPSDIGQYKLGNLIVLKGNSGSGTMITKIVPDQVNPIYGNITDNGMSLTLDAPATSSMMMQSPSGFGDLWGGSSFISNTINQTLPNLNITPSELIYKSGFLGALNVMTNKIGSDSVAQTKIINVGGDQKGAPINITENNVQNDLIVLNLMGAQQPPKININNVKNVLVAGVGSVEATSSLPVNLVGDLNDQTLIGSPSGNNFLSGGGGNDKLTGGAGGYNTFMIGSSGKVIINDFLKNGVSNNNIIELNIFGVQNLDDLKKIVSNIQTVTSPALATTFTLANTIDVTLVGLSSAFKFTPNMFKFDS